MEFRKAIFIDKDGTLIPNIPYNVNPEMITLSSNAVEGLFKLQQQGYLIVVVTNQSGVAKGLFKERELENVRFKIETLLNLHHIHLSGFYVCPHHPNGNIDKFSIQCNCRKPSSGLFFKAASELSINLYQSWMIGDVLNDVEAGNRAGCKSILLNNGNETEWKSGYFRKPTYIAHDLSQSADFILNNSFYGNYNKQYISVANRNREIQL